MTAYVLACLAPPALAQRNFKPLEQGDGVDVEEKIVLLRGVEARAEFAAWLEQMRSSDLKLELGHASGSRSKQDTLLFFRTVRHQNISVNLEVQLGDTAFQPTEWRRQEDPSSAARAPQSNPLTLSVRQAHIAYRFNPRSRLRIGKQYVSFDEGRGKIFHGFFPAIQFDCFVKTWCFPIKVAYIGPSSADAAYQFALRYPAWDEGEGLERRRFQVELFRTRYTENNVPLAVGFGAGRSNPSDQDDLTQNPTLVNDGAGTVFFDTNGVDIYGLRFWWDTSWLNLYLDTISSNGARVYHRRKLPTGDFVSSLNGGAETNRQQVRGNASELEVSISVQKNLRFGLRVMRADGDPNRSNAGQGVYARSLEGYYEITPGGYTGSRLYFNGSGGEALNKGLGLGHSITNTSMDSVLFYWKQAQNLGLSFDIAIHRLAYKHPVRNAQGAFTTDIGRELNVLMQKPLSEDLNLEWEFNYISAASGFSLTDHRPPVASPDDLSQAIMRLHYRF